MLKLGNSTVLGLGRMGNLQKARGEPVCAGNVVVLNAFQTSCSDRLRSDEVCDETIISRICEPTENTGLTTRLLTIMITDHNFCCLDRIGVLAVQQRSRRARCEWGASMRFATDTGGTFTDLIVEDEGRLHLFKAPTIPSNPVEGVLAAFSLAAEAFGVERSELLSRGDQFIHGTTHAINAIITKRVAKTALLVTEGHPEILLIREGGRQMPFDHSVRYPRAFIPRSLTFEVPGRIIASGCEYQPLDEDVVRAIVEDLRRQKVEAVAVCLLWSVTNPAHELRIGEVLREALPGVPVSLSHHLNPSLREYRRAIATSIDASLKPLMGRYIGGLTQAMRDAGFFGQCFVLTSQGSMVSAEEIRKFPILALNSGPSMAPIAGAHIAQIESDLVNTIIYDTGGTTFDVSLVRDGRVPYTHETWLGREFQSDLTGFPSIDVKSVGAGGGSIAWVDGGRVLHVGPQSAGAVPGPVCYGAGGVSPTVTDAALILGYIDPNFFLGGRIKLDLDASRDAVRQLVAEPLGFTIEEAAVAIINVWTESMVQAIADITVNQGIDPSLSNLIGGGGAAGLNAVAIANRLGCETVIIPEVGAGLSAAGAISSDVGRSFRRLFVTNTLAFDVAGVGAVLDRLVAEANSFAGEAGIKDAEARIDLFAEARYAHQVWEIDLEIDDKDIRGPDSAEKLSSAFHKEHERIFAFADTKSPVEVIAWRAQVNCKIKSDVQLRVGETAGLKEKQPRQAYFARVGWSEVPVHGFSALPTDEVMAGPGIVESPFTSVVVPPGAQFFRSPGGNLVVKPSNERRLGGASEKEFS